MQHALKTIEEGKYKPMTKQQIAKDTYDDRTTGKLFAAEVTGLVMSQAVSWGDKARQLLGMTIEARTAAVEALNKWKRDLKEGLIELHGMDKPRATKFINSATTQVSKINKIAEAMNGGMDEAMLRQRWGFSDGIENLGYECFVETARELCGSAAGRKPDTLLVKLSKWIEAQKKGADKFTAEDRKIMDELVKFYNQVSE